VDITTWKEVVTKFHAFFGLCNEGKESCPTQWAGVLLEKSPVAQVPVGIVTCRLVRVPKITGSSSGDWIYWHFGYSFSLNYN
jgi:hypothetical protein